MCTVSFLKLNDDDDDDDDNWPRCCELPVVISSARCVGCSTSSLHSCQWYWDETTTGALVRVLTGHDAQCTPVQHRHRRPRTHPCRTAAWSASAECQGTPALDVAAWSTSHWCHLPNHDTTDSTWSCPKFLSQNNYHSGLNGLLHLFQNTTSGISGILVFLWTRRPFCHPNESEQFRQECQGQGCGYRDLSLGLDTSRDVSRLSFQRLDLECLSLGLKTLSCGLGHQSWHQRKSATSINCINFTVHGN